MHSGRRLFSPVICGRSRVFVEIIEKNINNVSVLLIHNFEAGIVECRKRFSRQ